jgi:ubiquinone/menaquinone biosynthesis C-methylase UbiE
MSNLEQIRQTQLGFWNAASTVAAYARQEFLYQPEMRLLGMLRDAWSRTSMLDIGVGAGRTSLYFAELCAQYVGIDYADEMVRRCNERFRGRWPNATFVQGDAADLSGHQDASHDVVLFSFNGIDGLQLEQRERALSEMKRICRPGGLVVFSSHNLYCVPRLWKFQLKRHPRRFWEELQRWKQVHGKNQTLPEIMAGDFGSRFFDGAAGMNHQLYVRPEKQIAQLRAQGYSEIRVFSSVDGSEITDHENFAGNTQSWFYYICTRGK